MSDRKTPPFNRGQAEEQYADPTQADTRPAQQTAAQSPYAEDPLVELARIVSESAHTAPVTPGYATGYEGAPQPRRDPVPEAPAEPRDYSLPDDFGSDLEAELMAELAPVYAPEPQARPQPQFEAPGQQQPSAPQVEPRRAEPARVVHPMPRATPHVPAGDPSTHAIPASEARRLEALAREQRAPEPRVEPPVDYGQFEEPAYQGEPFFDPLAYSSPQPDPVDDSARYADAAAEALEAAVQEELRLAGYAGDFNEGYAEEPAAPEPVRQQFVQDEPVPEVVRADVAAPQSYGADSPDAFYNPSQAGALRGSFDQDYAPSYAQEIYPEQPAVYAQQEPVFPDVPSSSEPEPVAPSLRVPSPAAPELVAQVEPRFDVDDMQWPAAEGSLDMRADERGAVPGYDEPRFDDGQGYARQPQDDFELDDIFEAEETAAPQRVPQGVLPEHPKAEKRAAPRAEPKRRGMMAAAAVGAIVVLGGGAFLVSGLFGSDGPSGPPVRIAAEAGPFKVFPEATKASADPSPSKAIYDRVAGVQSRDEQLVPREEEPVSAVPTTDGNDLRTVGADGIAADTPARPKRVRTVVVRPDGTIIAAPDLPGTSASADDPQTAQAPTLDATPQAAPGADANIRTINARPVDSMAEATGNGVVGNMADGEARVPTTPERSATSGDAAGETLMPRPKPEAPETRVAAATPVSNAPIQRSGPLDLTGGNTSQPAAAARPAASTGSASVPSGSYVVQVSSQRTLEQAQQAYASMQRQFPSILGNVQAAYPSVDLGDRGTFYRVRIVAGGQAAANDLCTRLKDAGGDCFVRRSE
ncbi:sporulation related protein [Breoghania corrubedonensis]|uniref:Sporulation related protein n=1 Tax=Breoghania corrubedonensis TaxID=665038 RepID=A0A2T5V8G8_9HYPH|nr:SPOR domain-containing protein [Breoghania corrubedonensis]PTW60037.1 sporulation related protein [Breoghania corrubedonensis]